MQKHDNELFASCQLCLLFKMLSHSQRGRNETVTKNLLLNKEGIFKDEVTLSAEVCRMH